MALVVFQSTARCFWLLSPASQIMTWYEDIRWNSVCFLLMAKAKLLEKDISLKIPQELHFWLWHNYYSPQCEWLVVEIYKAVKRSSEITEHKSDGYWLIYCCQHLQFWCAQDQTAEAFSCWQIKLLKAFV